MTKAMDFYNEGAEINEEMQGSFDTYFENFENIYEALEKLNSATQLRAPKLKEIEQYIYINTAYLNRSEVNNFDPRVRFFRQKAEIRLLKCLDEF
jgi:hypothetical protein